MSTPVVFDVNVLVATVVAGNSTFLSWPSPPPVSANPASDCIGIINDAREFALWVSSHILTNVARVLTDEEDGFAWEVDRATMYIELLGEMAAASGGGLVEPNVRVADCTADYEDNRILEVALISNSTLIVSSDHHLLDMSPWRGIVPIVTPADFVGRVDWMRRRHT